MSWWDDFINYYIRPSTDFLTLGLSEIGWQQRDQQKAADENAVQQILSGASNDPTAAQGQIAQGGYSLTPEQEKWLDNLISQQNTINAQNFADYQSKNDLLNAASQLKQLGLSASGVLQTGGSVSNPVGAATNVRSNVAMERYQQKMALAKSVIGMVGSMASAGIYGSALGKAKSAASVLSNAASHSAYDALAKGIKPMSWKEIEKQLAALEDKYPNKYNPDEYY